MRPMSPLRPAAEYSANIPHQTISTPRHIVEAAREVYADRALIRFAPILLILSFLGFTVLLFVSGPLRFVIQNPIKLFSFLVLVHLSLFLGYWNGLAGRQSYYRGKIMIPRLVWWGSLLTLLLFFPTSEFRTGSWFPDVGYGFSDPGLAYQNSLLLREDGQPLVEYARILASPLLVAVLPLTVFYWSRLSWACRLLASGAIISTVLLYLGMATNKAIADTVILIPLMLLSAWLAGTIRLNWKQLGILLTTALILFLFFLFYFSSAIASRKGSAVQYNYFAATGGRVDQANIWINNSPPAVSGIIVALDFYLTPGYYALSLALDEPFVPMFGIGNSMFLSRQVSRILDDPSIELMSYPFRIERHGWDAMRLWSSIYPWLASDFSFPGVIVVVFFIGRLFSISWKETLAGKNPYAVVLFSQIVIMLLYFPANNQLMQSGEGFIAFWFTLILWLSKRNKYPLATRPLPPQRMAIPMRFNSR